MEKWINVVRLEKYNLDHIYKKHEQPKESLEDTHHHRDDEFQEFGDTADIDDTYDAPSKVEERSDYIDESYFHKSDSDEEEDEEDLLSKKRKRKNERFRNE